MLILIPVSQAAVNKEQVMRVFLPTPHPSASPLIPTAVIISEGNCRVMHFTTEEKISCSGYVFPPKLSIPACLQEKAGMTVNEMNYHSAVLRIFVVGPLAPRDYGGSIMRFLYGSLTHKRQELHCLCVFFNYYTVSRLMAGYLRSFDAVETEMRC